MSTRENTFLPTFQTTCIDTKVPQIHRTDGFDADLVIYVTSKNLPGESFGAWAVNFIWLLFFIF